jgi:hypothetical protein
MKKLVFALMLLRRPRKPGRLRVGGAARGERMAVAARATPSGLHDLAIEDAHHFMGRSVFLCSTLV